MSEEEASPPSSHDDPTATFIRLHSASAGSENELGKKVWLKLDLWVLPVLSMFHLLSFLDRTNIGNARVAGLQNDLGITNYQYTIALTVTYIPYILAEQPSNLLLKRIGPKYMLPTMLTLWGVVTTLQGLVKIYAGLLACRFFIGLLECLPSSSQSVRGLLL